MSCTTLLASMMLLTWFNRQDTTGNPFVRLERSVQIEDDMDGAKFQRAAVAVRVRHVARYTSQDGQSFLDLTFVRDMSPTCPDGVQLKASLAAESIKYGVFTSWYEASISSARAEELFKENETMTTGDESSWDTNTLTAAGVLDAVSGAALGMVRAMDGVGAKVDNGQSCKFRAPPSNMREAEAELAMEVDGAGVW